MSTHVLPDHQISEKKRTELLAHGKGLFRHAKRPEWGLAILAWEELGRRGYQFDDGRLRVFKEGYYSFMEPVAPVDDQAELRQDLREAIQLNAAQRTRKPLTPEYSFEEQLTIFGTLFPDGFGDPSWICKYRDSGDDARRKSHREPALHDAATVLSGPRLRDLIAKGEHAQALADVSTLLVSTDLVPLRQAETLGEVPADLRRNVAQALHEMLHGEGKFGPRFRTWVLALREALGKRPAWRLATAPAALLHPDRHVCVRPSTFKRQAAVFAPSRVYTARARRRAYENFRRVARATRERLVEAGLRPRDLLDVHDFIWVTLRPAAARHLAAS